MTSDWMVRFLGKIGTACVLFAGAMTYFIWRFNPEFKLPDVSSKNKAASVIPEPDREEAAGALLFIEEPVTKNKKNKLKNEEAIPLIISEEEPEPDPQSPFLREEPVTKEIPSFPLQKTRKRSCQK